MNEETRVTEVRSEPRPEIGAKDACLVLIYPPGSSLGKRFELSAAEIVLGRGHDCDIRLDRAAVSRRHARVERVSEGFRVVDLGSTNGSYVNDAPIHEHVLRDGDRLKIGNAIFKFLTGGNIESAYHEEIYRMTIVDGLTQIYNKRYLLEQLERELARCGRNRRPLSLVMFDIDHFKRINDAHGHLAGDRVLKELAARIERRVRKDEIFARYGGEEFSLVLPEATRANAVRLAGTIRRLVEAEPFAYEQERIAVTISCGVATVSEDMPALAFIRLADEALYRAKRAGRNRVESDGETGAAAGTNGARGGEGPSST